MTAGRELTGEEVQLVQLVLSAQTEAQLGFGSANIDVVALDHEDGTLFFVIGIREHEDNGVDLAVLSIVAAQTAPSSIRELSTAALAAYTDLAYEAIEVKDERTSPADEQVETFTVDGSESDR